MTHPIWSTQAPWHSGRNLVLVALFLAGSCATPPRQPDLSRVEGIWEYFGNMYVRMDVSASGEVAWQSDADLMNFRGRTTAVFRDGRLVLAEAMNDCAPGERSVFHLVHYGGREYLVADDRIRALGMDYDRFIEGFWLGLRRRLPKRVLVERFDRSASPEERTKLLWEWSLWPTTVAEVAWLAAVAREDRDADARYAAYQALDWVGQDRVGEVLDRSAYDAAQQALLQLPDRDAGRR